MLFHIPGVISSLLVGALEPVSTSFTIILLVSHEHSHSLSCQILSLPLEILVMFALYVDLESLSRFRLACSTFRDVTETGQWQSLHRIASRTPSLNLPAWQSVSNV